MNKLEIASAVRQMVVYSAGIDPENDLKTFGMNFNPSNKPLWVEEFINGGEISRASNSREKISGLIMEYHFNVPAGRSVKTAIDKVNSCLNEIHVDEKLSGIGGSCFIDRIKTDMTSGKDFSTVKLIITLSSVSAG